MAAIIAELCQNHRGDRAILRDMIGAVAEAGADYAKIQTIRVRELTRRDRFEEGLVAGDMRAAIKRPFQTEYDRLAPLELSAETEAWFVQECHRVGVKPLTTAFTRAAVPSILQAGFREIKVASYDCASFPLLQELRGRFDRMWVSTGATFDHEIKEAARLLRGTPFAFLHCVTIYPTPLVAMNLARMEWLRQFTPTVGLSDHSLVARDGIKAALVALALRADVIERHFTILPADQTKDGPVSITPALLRELVQAARMPRDDLAKHAREVVPEFDSLLGAATRELGPEELLNRDYYRGRFASRSGGRFIYNWEEQALE